MQVARKQEQRARDPLLARIEELIHQIFLDADVSREHMGDESIRECRLFVERSSHLLLGRSSRRRATPLAAIDQRTRDFTQEKPVNDQVFEVMRRMYAYH